MREWCVVYAAPEAASVAALIWHSSDCSISGIAKNSRIEKLAQPKFDAAALPVPSWVGAPAQNSPCLVYTHHL